MTRLIALLVFVLAAGRSAEKFELTIDSLSRGPGLVGYPPQDVRWSGTGDRVYFQWKLASDPLNKDLDTYVANRDGSGLRKLTEEEAKLAPPTAGDTDRDHTKTVYSRDGDLFVYDHASGNTRRISKTADAETDPHFLPDGKRIYFTRSGNLFVYGLNDGSTVQVTAILPPGSKDPDEEKNKKGTASQEFLKKEEKDLLETIRDRARKREEEEAKKKQENPRKPFIPQARQTVIALQLTPDGKYAIAAVSEAIEGVKKPAVPVYVTEAGYSETVPAREKVGDPAGHIRLAILNVETGEVKWADHGMKQPAPPAKDAKKDDKPKEVDRLVDWALPVWSEDGTKAVVMVRSADNKDRWILALDPVTAKTRTLVAGHDDAWVAGPGAQTLGWLKGDDAVYFQSERDGWSHLYRVAFAGGEAQQLTSGKWEVQGVQLSRDRSAFYLVTSEADLGERHIYRMPAAGGARVRLTAEKGQYQATLSPDEKALALLYSYTTKPPELFVQENRTGAPVVKVTASPAPEFWTYPWQDANIVQMPARDGVLVPGRLYKPANFRAGGPAVIFVHGAGYLQNVHRGWSSYFRESMFHQLLMKRGYLVIDVDYRGSAGYGRDWRTAIYRHMGGKDLEDQVDTARWIVKQHGVDPKRIGLYGGSYGGFITLMALFTEPDTFAAGAALRPVTDWAHYNHGYTSNILNIPAEDAEAYRKSSPIYFASGLKGALLICHGVVDVNVHFQDTVRLVQKLIELRKENWELAIYPVEDHGFVQPTSWADEYKRIFKLFERTIGSR